MTTSQILVVEDENIVALDLKIRLNRLGYTVIAIASSGEEAIAKATDLKPDLVLMDIRLKGAMDGIKAAQEIINRFGIPVIYLTALADKDTTQRATETAPYGYILKPFDEEELQAAVQAALNA